MLRVVAIVGMCGAGKSTVANMFKEAGFSYIRFGAITMDIIREKCLDVTPDNEKKVREALREQYGMSCYAKLNIPKIDKALESSSVIIDGLYSWSEYKELKEKYGPKLDIVAVYAAPQVRWERLTQRETDESLRDRKLTIEQAKARDLAEIENIEKAGPIAMANYTISNQGSTQDLIKQVKKLITRINGETTSRPTWNQYFMDLVNEVEKRSTCDMQHSGCVIVRDKRVLCTGYSGAPSGIVHCDQVGHKIVDGACIRSTHAEQNAICQAAKEGLSLEGAILYTKHSPCLSCTNLIINVGIKSLIIEFSSDTSSQELLKEAGIQLHILNN